MGVAISDPFNRYAMPLKTYFRTGNLKEDVEALKKIAEEEDAGKIICGLPVFADGKKSDQTDKTVRFFNALKESVKVPVFAEDERYTTLAARDDLKFLGLSSKKDKKEKAVDSLAASYILENYLKRQEREMSYKEDFNDYEDENIVELVDEDGQKRRFEHIMTFDYKDEWYVALAPEESKDGEEDEVAIYHLLGGEDDEELEIVEDEALLEEVFEHFCDLYEDSEDEEDPEEIK